MSLLPLFPEPIFKKNFEFNELDLTNNSDVVFEEKGFEKAREIALQCTGEVFYGVLKVSPETGIYITKSFVNQPTPPLKNSVLTGVIMLSDGMIRFSKNEKRFMFDFSYTSENEFNLSECVFKIKKGDVILFPSQLQFQIKGDHITWYTFIYNVVNKYLFVPPPKVFGKPNVDWELLPK